MTFHERLKQVLSDLENARNGVKALQSEPTKFREALEPVKDDIEEARTIAKGVYRLAYHDTELHQFDFGFAIPKQKDTT